MMREEDKKFWYLEPSKELYKSRTWKYYEIPGKPKPAFPCSFEHWIEAETPFRILYFREKGSQWKGEKVHFVCAKHYKEITGKEL